MKYSFSSMLGAVLLFSGVFAFSACGNDESYPDSTVTIAMATVEKQPQYDAPYFILDNGEKLWVVQNAVPYRDLKTGERIFGSYTFLEAGESGFAYDIRLNDYAMVPVQDIIGLNPDNMDSIGNMKVQIKNIWFSNAKGELVYGTAKTVRASKGAEKCDCVYRNSNRRTQTIS